MNPDIDKETLPVILLILVALFLTGYLSFNYQDFKLNVGFGYGLLAVTAFIAYFTFGTRRG